MCSDSCYLFFFLSTFMLIMQLSVGESDVHDNIFVRSNASWLLGLVQGLETEVVWNIIILAKSQWYWMNLGAGLSRTLSKVDSCLYCLANMIKENVEVCRDSRRCVTCECVFSVGTLTGCHGEVAVHAQGA